MNVPEILYQRAMEAGFTVEAACNLLAQIQAESGFIANNAENRINRVVSDEEYVRRADNDLITYNGKNFIYDEVGFGYAQWTFWSRKKFLLEYCKGRGLSVASHEAQKEFIFVEMERDFPAIWDLCRTSHDMTLLMEKLVRVWENPKYPEAAIRERTPYAKAWYSKFNGWTASNSTTTSETTATNEIVLDASGILVEKLWPPRTIQKGLNWPEAYLAQSLLKCHGYNVLICGVFADSMEKKVKEFQKDNSLKADGIIGPMTWKALMKLPSNY